MKKNIRLRQIKELIRKECHTLGCMKPWFYSAHLLGVEKWAIILLKRLPKANKEVVMLGVWLHDLQRVRGLKGDHAKVGAREAVKVLKQFDYSQETIKHVREIILSHVCDSVKPKTLEAQILASADAMSHYINDFYLTIAVTGERDLKEFKEWALEKLDRDLNKKIFFSFACKMIKKRHSILTQLLTMG